MAKKADLVAVQDYLQGELQSQIKHEFVNGKIYAMTGASEAHNIISGNMFAALHHFLKASPCKVFMSDMKTRVATTQDDCFYYPDIQVCCDKNDTAELYKTSPCIIIEVLSASTERFDRAEKFHRYKKLPGLQEYVLIAQDSQRVEIYRRVKQWDFELYREGEIRFDAIGFVIDFSALYEQVSFIQ